MLTDADCRNAICPPGKARHRLSDGAGLYLEVSPAGSRRWFWKFYPDGKESRLALGSYPEVGLKAARKARDEARRTRREGKNPAQQRKADKLASKAASADTFAAVAREFHSTQRSGWSDTYADKWLRLMERDLFPWLGAQPLRDVSAPVLLSALQRVEARGAHDTAHALRQYAGQVYRLGIATGRCDRNPAADLCDALKPLKVRHMGAVLDPAKAGELMRNLHGYTGQPVTRAALLLSALLFQRPGNIRAMEWAEVDAERALWTIPAAKMKRTVHGKVNGRPHLVPLAPQALAVLEDLRPLTGHGRYVFPSLLTGEQCMSENTIRAALRRMGYGNDEMTAHGFRAMARTLMAEHLPGIDPEAIEAQLAHGKSGPLGMAYDRAEYVAQRRALMVQWADYLDRLREGAKVIPMQPRVA
jgi:integrase